MIRVNGKHVKRISPPEDRGLLRGGLEPFNAIKSRARVPLKGQLLGKDPIVMFRRVLGRLEFM